MTLATLIVPYRDRPAHAQSLLDWLGARPGGKRARDLELLLVEASAAPTDVRRAVEAAGGHYRHLSRAGPFHKTAALNRGLAEARGELVFAYDVDLLPVGDTLDEHIELAAASPRLLLTGHRLMCSRSRVRPGEIEPEARRAVLAPEDKEHCMQRHLFHQERFGINPAFRREVLQQLGGWDEGYRGWGAEDQDVVDRYLATGPRFARCPQLLYLHLHHEPQADWNEMRFVMTNRERYYSRKRRGIR